MKQFSGTRNWDKKLTRKQKKWFKSKKPRWSPEQAAELEKYFEKSEYLHVNDRSQMKERTGLSIRKINVWFTLRRKQLKDARAEESACHTIVDDDLPEVSDEDLSEVKTDAEPIYQNRIPQIFIQKTPYLTSNLSKNTLGGLENSFLISPDVKPVDVKLLDAKSQDAKYLSESIEQSEFHPKSITQPSKAPNPNPNTAKFKSGGIIIWSPEQLAMLEKFFEKSEYMDVTGREQLVKQTGLSIKQISQWFCNRRKRLKDAINRDLPDAIQRSSYSSKLSTNPIGELEKAFARSSYLRIDLDELVERTGFTHWQISEWFRNKGKLLKHTTNDRIKIESTGNEESNSVVPLPVPSSLPVKSPVPVPFPLPVTSVCEDRPDSIQPSLTIRSASGPVKRLVFTKPVALYKYNPQ